MLRYKYHGVAACIALALLAAQAHATPIVCPEGMFAPSGCSSSLDAPGPTIAWRGFVPSAFHADEHRRSMASWSRESLRSTAEGGHAVVTPETERVVSDASGIRGSLRHDGTSGTGDTSVAWTWYMPSTGVSDVMDAIRYHDPNGIFIGAPAVYHGPESLGESADRMRDQVLYSAPTMHEVGAVYAPGSLLQMVTPPGKYVMTWTPPRPYTGGTSPQPSVDGDHGDDDAPGLDDTSVQVVPEPAALGMFAFGALLVCGASARRRRSRRNMAAS